MYSSIVPISLQLLQRGPNIESVLAADSASALQQIIDADMVQGNGKPEAVAPGIGTVSGEILGYIPQAGGVVTYTSSSPTAAERVQAIGNGIQTVASLRNRPAQCVLMNPSRYTQIATSHDSVGSPLQRVGVGDTDGDVLHSADVLGYIGGVPVFGIPSLWGAFGTDHDQDGAVICRPNSDDLLFVGDPIFSLFDETLAPSLTVLYICRQYLAFCVRLPSSVVTVSGTGFAVSDLY
jgi:hypothetical protein